MSSGKWRPFWQGLNVLFETILTKESDAIWPNYATVSYYIDLFRWRSADSGMMQCNYLL